MKAVLLQMGFFVFLIAATAICTFFIFQPYLGPVFLAIIFAVIFNSLHENVIAAFGKRENLSALVSVALVIILFVLPVFILGTLLLQEVVQFYGSLSESQSSGFLARGVDSAQVIVDTFLPSQHIDVRTAVDVRAFAASVVGWLTDHIAGFFSGFFRAALNTFLMLLALFYFFRDGKKLVKRAIMLSPLSDMYDETILGRVHNAINSVVRGQLLVGLIQGLLVGIGFWIFGVPSPLIWGSLAAVASLIPTVGTGLVALPGVAYLFFTGPVLPAVGLLLWSILLVGLVDNFLGPILIERGVKIHPFLILLSVLGGLNFFGPVGFIAGPVILSLLFVLLQIYPQVLKSALGKS